MPCRSPPSRGLWPAAAGVIGQVSSSSRLRSCAETYAPAASTSYPSGGRRTRGSRSCRNMESASLAARLALTQLGQGGREWPDARCRGSRVVEILAVAAWFGEEEFVECRPATEDEFLPEVGIGSDGAYGPREEQVLFNLLAGRPGVGDTSRGDGVVGDHRSGSTTRFTRTFHRRSSVPTEPAVGSSRAGVGGPASAAWARSVRSRPSPNSSRTHPNRRCVAAG